MAVPGSGSTGRSTLRWQTSNQTAVAGTASSTDVRYPSGLARSRVDLSLEADILVDRSGSMGGSAGVGQGTAFDVVRRGLHWPSRRSARRTGSRYMSSTTDLPSSAVARGHRPAVCGLDWLKPPGGGTEDWTGTGRRHPSVQGQECPHCHRWPQLCARCSRSARTGCRFTVVLIGENSLDANIGHLAPLTGGQIFVAPIRDNGNRHPGGA